MEPVRYRLFTYVRTFKEGNFGNWFPDEVSERNMVTHAALWSIRNPTEFLEAEAHHVGYSKCTSSSGNVNWSKILVAVWNFGILFSPKVFAFFCAILQGQRMIPSHSACLSLSIQQSCFKIFIFKKKTLTFHFQFFWGKRCPRSIFTALYRDGLSHLCPVKE